jgi:hypothetical protein
VNERSHTSLTTLLLLHDQQKHKQTPTVDEIMRTMTIWSAKSFVAAVFLVATFLQATSAFFTSHIGFRTSKSVPGGSPLTFESNFKLHMTADPTAKKETTWDRITGPKLFKTVTNWNGIHSVPLVPLRIATGLLMIHHGTEGMCSILSVSVAFEHPNHQSCHRWVGTR